jgi:hypothetical protein
LTGQSGQREAAKYLDQLATAYLAFDDKAYLPSIVKTVAATIARETGRSVGSNVWGDPSPERMAHVPREARQVASNRPAASLPAENFETRPSASADRALRVAREAPMRERPERAANGADTPAAISASDAGVVAKPMRAGQPRPVVMGDVDEERDLTELLKRIS